MSVGETNRLTKWLHESQRDQDHGYGYVGMAVGPSRHIGKRNWASLMTGRFGELDSSARIFDTSSTETVRGVKQRSE
jgi:hypothetical protein